MAYSTPQTGAATHPANELNHEQTGINAAPPQYPVGGHINGQGNEKSAASYPPHDAGAFDPTKQQPQQNEYQQHEAQQQQQQQHHQAPLQNQNYASATPLGSLQQGPTPVDCPSCGVRALTQTDYVSGGTTHLAALLFCCVTCLGCIPYMAGWFKDVEHKCGNCGALLAVWHRSGRTEVVQHRVKPVQ